jgi:hypothetical protein
VPMRLGSVGASKFLNPDYLRVTHLLGLGSLVLLHGLSIQNRREIVKGFVRVFVNEKMIMAAGPAYLCRVLYNYSSPPIAAIIQINTPMISTI